MPPLRPKDQTLLDRLNALKPTNLTLDQASNSLNLGHTALGDPGPQFPSKDDALAARLRILRNSSASGDGDQPSSASTDAALPPVDGKQNRQGPPVLLGNAADHQPDDVEDCLFGGADDQATLDEFLEGLDDVESDLDYSELNPPNNGRKSIDKPTDKDVSDLLESLRKGSSPRGPSQAAEGRISGTADSDDSDGEHMTRDVEKLLAQFRDETSLADQHSIPGASEPADHTEEASGSPPLKPPNKSLGNDNPLSLPAVPSSQPLVDPGIENADPKPPSSPRRRKSIDFENDITTRMASLKGLGAGINVDDFGLPSAPTFRPADRLTPAATAAFGKVGYTDEDQKTWCIVCLDDATVRCVGCDDDVFCARCWKDMHMGPSAGYDERGHKWEKFLR